MLQGGNISRRAAVFSGDGRLIIAPCGQTLRLYSTATGEQVGQLEGHNAEVTCVAIDHNNDNQVYSGSLDGTVRHWDITTGDCLVTMDVQQPVRHMAVHATLQLMYLSIEWRDGEAGRVVCWHLDKMRAAPSAMKTYVPGPLAMQPTGSLVATLDKHSLFVWQPGPDFRQPLNLPHTRPYTCVAVSPDEGVVAAGDTSGRILVYHNVTAAVERHMAALAAGEPTHTLPKPTCTTVHWHASPVGSLSFSPDGVYLRSGGREGVLVSWQLDSNKPNYLPRLGGAIIGMSHCKKEPAHLLLRQADNTLRVINLATKQATTNVFGLRPGVPHIPHSQQTPATCLNPATGLLAVPTHNATLQLFDVVHNRHAALLQVALRNEVSSAEAGTAQPVAGPAYDQVAQQVSTTSPWVSHTAYTHNGHTLITVDVRPGAGLDGLSSETTLRFWNVQARGTQHVLNTLADDPHRGPVSCVATHPHTDMVLTAGGEAAAEFKLWERIAIARRPGFKGEKATCWRCRAVASYRSQPFTAASFSGDGSLLALAVAYPTQVTLWDPVNCTLVATLPSPPELATDPANTVTNLSFISGAPFLVGSTGATLVVWNLLTTSVQWACPLPCTTLAADPVKPVFAVAVHVPEPQTEFARQQHQARHKHQHEKQQQQQHPRGQQQQQQQHSAGVPAGGEPGQGDEQQEAQGGNPPSQPQSGASRRGGRRKGDADTQQPASQSSAGASAGAAAAGDKPEAAAAAAGDQPTQQSAPKPAAAAQRQPRALARQCCWVLVFEPSSPVPVQIARVPNTARVQVLFPNSHVLGGAHGVAQAQAQVSPLLALTAERSYLWLGRDRDSAAGARRPQSGGAGAAAAAQPSAFEAAFGTLAPQAAPMEVDGDEEEAGVGGAEARWQQLLDAPSHLLPPPTALASAFLQLLTEVQ